MTALMVYITAPDMDWARTLASALVGDRLCACANIIGSMESVYWWHGELESANECIILLKTTEDVYPALEQRAREIHPYDTPCIVALPLSRGYAPFMQWIAEETRS